MRKCVLVLGMHRSGTSVLAGTLNIMGADLGKNILPPDKSNERGYFENSKIYQINEEILSKLGSSWKSLNELPPEWMKNTKYKKKLRTILNKEFGDSDFFVIKDPRLCLLLPIYESVLKEAGIKTFYIIVKRKDIEIAESLKKRDGFSINYSLKLCKRYNYNLQKHISNKEKIILNFEDIINNTEETCMSLKKFIGLKNKKTIEFVKNFIEKDLKHHNLDLQKYIEKIAEELEQNNIALNDKEKKIRDLQIGLQNSEIILDDKEKKIRDLQIGLQNSEIILDDKEKKIRDLQIGLQNSEIILDDKEKKIEETKRRIDDLNGIILHNKNRIKELSERIQTFLESYSWRITYPLRVIHKGLTSFSSMRTFKRGILNFRDKISQKINTDYEIKRINLKPRIAVIVHLYYTELWDELAKHINNIPFNFDTYINLVENNYPENIIDKIKRTFPRAVVTSTPNKGFDIGGLMKQIQNINLEKYDLVCKIHSKKSKYKMTNYGDNWRKELLDSMLGSKRRVLGIIKLFENKKIGMISSEKHISNKISTNEEKYLLLCDKLKIEKKFQDIEYFEGTMFWCRSEILEKIKKIGMKTEDFEDTRIKVNDGQLAHAFERVFGALCKSCGYYLYGVPEKIYFHDKEQIKLIPFYLPQYHQIPENDRFWGKGFTDWINVKKAKPLFEGHYQPHVPDLLGYYNLKNPKVSKEQANLAKKYGIHGFCYYYYWFNGKKLLESPIERVLKTKEPDFPFCICWANENWTRSWDGLNKEILINQGYSVENNLKLIKEIIPYLKDKRYIRINGKPLFIIYRADNFPNLKKTADLWREECRKNDVGEIHLALVQSFEETNPKKYGFDSSIEFPPLQSQIKEMPKIYENQDFKGKIYNYHGLAKIFASRNKRDYKTYPGIMPSWDNTSRRKNNSFIFVNSDPLHYKLWLKRIIRKLRKDYKGEDKVIFINAWNEWAEGCHLEPDKKFGLGYLEATREALETE